MRRELATEEKLIWLSAGTLARRQAGRERAAELAGSVDWQRLAETLQRRRLLATLGPRLRELSGDRVDEAFVEAVEMSLAKTRRQIALVQLISTRLREELTVAGVRSLPLKGPTLGEALYGDPGRRPSGDIDLLVAVEDLERAVAIVRRLGYGPPVDQLHDGDLPLLHHVLVHAGGKLPPVELHWRVHWYERDFARERLLPPVGADSAWRPAATDELVAQLLFYARDGLIGLRHPTDIGAWWDRCGGDLEPFALDPLSHDYPALAGATLAAARAAEAVVGLPAAKLTRDAKLRPRQRAAVHLANPLPHSREAQIFADMGLVDGLLTPAGSWRAFLGRQLVLPAEALPRTADGTRTSRIGHGARVLGRYGLAASRLFDPRPATAFGLEL